MSSSLSGPAEASKPKLLDQTRQLMRLRHYSLRTEEAYVGWIRRYILFHGKRHPRDLAESDIASFHGSPFFPLNGDPLIRARESNAAIM